MSNTETAPSASQSILTKRGWTVVGVVALVVALTQIPGIRYGYHADSAKSAFYRVDRLTGKIAICRHIPLGSRPKGDPAVKCFD